MQIVPSNVASLGIRHRSLSPGRLQWRVPRRFPICKQSIHMYRALRDTSDGHVHSAVRPCSTGAPDEPRPLNVHPLRRTFVLEYGREMTYRAIFGRSLTDYRRHWWRFVPIGFFLYFWLALATTIVRSQRTGVFVLSSLALLLLGQFFLLAFHVVEGSEAREGHAAADMTDTLRKLLKCCAPLFLVGLVAVVGLFAAGVVVFLAFTTLGGTATTIAFTAVCLVLALVVTRWSLIAPVIMLEERGLVAAFRRSNMLVKGATFRVLCLLLCAQVFAAVGRAVLGGILGVAMVAESSELREFVIEVVAEGVTASFFVLVLAHIYWELRGQPEAAAQAVPVLT